MIDKSHLKWPDPDDNLVIDAMLNDPNSHQWIECQIFVTELVQQLMGDLLPSIKEDIVQNAMLSIYLYLPGFQRSCRLTTWIVKVVRSRINDAGREELKRNKRQAFLTADAVEDDRNEVYISKIRSLRTIEEECLLLEEFRDAYKAIQEYLSTHSKRERNMRILDMFIVGFNQEEIARDVGYPVPVVGYVIRSVQRYLREQRGY